jgi:hypothetical protein
MPNTFLEEARLAFDHICGRFNMHCVFASRQAVRYENESVFLNINFDGQRSFELGVEIGKISLIESERPFSLGEILRLCGPEHSALIDGLMIREAIHLPEALRHLAELTSNHAAEFLRGGDLPFAKLASQRQTEGDLYALEKTIHTARARSEVAWKKRDHRGVVSALAPIEQHLSPAERKRLEYSRHHLAP